MEQGVPGSQNEPFFELLHPNASRAPPPPPPPPPPPRFFSPSASSADPEADGLAPDDSSPVPEISPSYEFHLTHSSKSREPVKSDDADPNLEDSRPFAYPGSSFAASEGDHQQGSTNETAKGSDKSRSMEVMETCDQVTMAAIDRTMKNYTDNLLHVLQSMSERVSQLESTVQGLEHAVAGLKLAEGEKHEQSNGRLMKLELLIQEVHSGMQLLHDKYKLEEAKSHLTNVYLDDQKAAVGGILQTSADGWQQPRLAKEEGPPAAYSELPPQLAQHAPPQYTPHPQSHYPHAPPQPPPQLQAYASSQNMLPPPPSMNGPSNPPATQQPYLPSVQHLPTQPSAHQAPQPSLPQHSIQATSFHNQPPPQSPSQSAYNLPMETAAYGHMQPQQHHSAPPTPASSTYLPEPQQYSAGMHGGPPRQQQLPPQELIYPSPQQHNPVGSQHMYESNVGRIGPTTNSMAPPSYGQVPPSKPAPPVSMYDTTSGGGYGTPPYRTAQPVPSAPSGGGGGYPRLPTAQPLQHGLPAAAGVSSGPSTRSPLEEVIEKVAAMGFSREQVRAVVRQLTENGQAVDMNVVLDKLMNGGDATQAPRGWFGRR